MSEERPREVHALVHGLTVSIRAVSCGLYHSLALSADGSVLAFGKGGGGRLGQGSEDSEYAPARVEALSTLRVAQIAAGGLHSAALTSEGECYTWGFGGYGQLGQGEEVMKLVTPRRVELLAPVPLAHISCGGTHTCAVSRAGELFSWGRPDQGRLGLPADSEAAVQPLPVRIAHAPPHLAAVSCGGFHTAVLTRDGRISTFGGGQNGELGTGSFASRHEAREVQALAGRVASVCCGGMHTVALTHDGEVYTWGFGGFGQLGTGRLENEATPRRVEALRGVRLRAVAAGGSHTCATDGERVWAWGANREGAVGHEAGLTCSSSPREVAGLPPGRVLALAAGGHHSAALVAL